MFSPLVQFRRLCKGQISAGYLDKGRCGDKDGEMVLFGFSKGAEEEERRDRPLGSQTTTMVVGFSTPTLPPESASGLSATCNTRAERNHGRSVSRTRRSRPPPAPHTT